MNRINLQLEKIKNEKRLGLMTHVVIGYKSLKDTRALVNMMAEGGVDFIELQIPFSDPIGDGPTIHRANTKALSLGIHVRDAFSLIKTLREKDKIDIPLFFMTYLNIPFTYGLEKFCKDSKDVGIDGFILPDYNLKLENVDHLNKICEKHNQILIRFASMDSTVEHLKFLANKADGFIYCFSTRGTTGAREELDSYLVKHLKKLRKYFKIPLAVGFGISSADHIKSLKGSADMVIVGSAIIKVFEESGLAGARAKIKELVKACRV